MHDALDEVEIEDVQLEAPNIDVKVEIVNDLKFLKQDKDQISKKYGISKPDVTKTINEFMAKLKSCQKLGKKTGKPNKMSKFQKDWLNNKINGSILGRHFTHLDIKKLLLNKFPEITTISLTTLLRVLRKDLSMSFKKATRLKTKMATHEKKV